MDAAARIRLEQTAVTMEREAAAIRALLAEDAEPFVPWSTDRRLNTGEAAKLARVSDAVIRDWIKKKRVDGARIGGRWTVSEASLQVFLQNRAELTR
ncbi:helix-turn-helix domain-containing protein [Faunimonas pinastri]|uniref:helix-turn-helix domain-containing protein n=1 Tax=Faunimonas pinastri TaxID=1855383 RepID=UPI000B825A4B